MGCTNELIPLPNKKHQQNIHILVFRHSLKSILAVIFEWSCCDNFWYFPYQHSGEQSNIVNMILVFQRKILYLIMKLKMCSTLQMFAGNCRDFAGKSECRDFKRGIACIPEFSVHKISKFVLGYPAAWWQPWDHLFCDLDFCCL